VSYQFVVSGWHDFYIVAGTASATLAGLLFVALSLHLRIVVASADVRSLARVTLANFGAVLILALFMMIPEAPAAAASQLIGVGLVSIVVTVPSLVGAAKGRGRTLRFMRLQRLVLRFGLSGLSYLTIIVAGILLLASLDSAFIWLVIATVVLLLISLRNTWDLLVTVGDATLGGQAELD